MKVAMSVQGQSADSKVDQRFGRCNAFAILDTESGELEFVANHEKDKGSGINAANTILKYNPDAVIVGNIGPKAFQVLSRAGLKIYEGLTGSIQESARLLQDGKLKEISSPNN